MKKITKTLFIAALFVIFAFQTKVSAATPTLQQIANSFNSSDTVKEFAKAKSYWTASADENTLTIKATANGSKDSATYTLNGTILSLTFTKDNSLFSAVSATILIDSIGHLHGYAYGDMFPTLNETEVISKYTLENEGLHMEKTSDGGGKIQIDISKKIPILDQSQIYIKPSDLISSTGQKFSSYSKGNLLFMKDTKDGNTVFIFAEEPKLTISTYKSILSVIEVYYGAKEAATLLLAYPSVLLFNVSGSATEPLPVVPIVYCLPAIVTLSPLASSLSRLNTVVPFPLSVSFPARPASCAATFTSEEVPSTLPFNRYVSLNLVVSETRSISVVSWSISS